MRDRISVLLMTKKKKTEQAYMRTRLYNAESTRCPVRRRFRFQSLKTGSTKLETGSNDGMCSEINTKLCIVCNVL